MPLSDLSNAMRMYGLPVTVETGEIVEQTMEERKKGARVLSTWYHSPDYHRARAKGLRQLLMEKGLLKHAEPRARDTEGHFIKNLTPIEAAALLKLLREEEIS